MNNGWKLQIRVIFDGYRKSVVREKNPELLAEATLERKFRNVVFYRGAILSISSVKFKELKNEFVMLIGGRWHVIWFRTKFSALRLYRNKLCFVNSIIGCHTRQERGNKSALNKAGNSISRRIFSFFGTLRSLSLLLSSFWQCSILRSDWVEVKTKGVFLLNLKKRNKLTNVCRSRTCQAKCRGFKRWLKKRRRVLAKNERISQSSESVRRVWWNSHLSTGE